MYLIILDILVEYGYEINNDSIRIEYTLKEDLNSNDIVWKSSNPSVASVNNGIITTYAEGTITGETAQPTITPTSTALLNKQSIVGETTTTENNYLTVTLEYLANATDVEEDASATYTLTLQYEQTTAN